jgi:hypothetical protein
MLLHADLLRRMSLVPWPSSRTGIFLAVAAGLAFVASHSGRAADRLVMSSDNVVEIDVKDCVRTAATAVSEENLDAFVGCFTEKQRAKIRRRAAIVFVTHSLDLELLDNHLVSESSGRAELAVKYRVTLTDDSFDIVSLLDMAKEAGGWRIASEKVESNVLRASRRSTSTCGGPVFRFGGGGEAVLKGGVEDFLPADIGRRPGGCANGRCGL